MTKSALKEKINEYLASSDDKIIKVVYTILDEHLRAKQESTSLSEKQKKELDKRMKLYESGKMEVFSWSTVYKELKNRKKK